MYVYAEAIKGHWIPRTGIIDGCEVLCGFSEVNSDLLKEQQVFLSSEISIQFQDSLKCSLYIY